MRSYKDAKKPKSAVTFDRDLKELAKNALLYSDANRWDGVEGGDFFETLGNVLQALGLRIISEDDLEEIESLAGGSRDLIQNETFHYQSDTDSRLQDIENIASHVRDYL